MAKLCNALAWFSLGKARHISAWEKWSFGLQRICTASQEMCVAWVWRCRCRLPYHPSIGIAQAAWQWCSKAPQTAAAARQSSIKRTCASDWHRRAKLRQSHVKEMQSIEKLRMCVERSRFGFAAESTGIAL